MECVYIGKKFYNKSNTVLGTVYEIKRNGVYHRTDWSQIIDYLERKKSIHIRPATEREIYAFNLKLDSVKKIIEKEEWDDEIDGDLVI